MKRFRLSPQAKSDLQAIHEYIAVENQAAADQLLDRFFDHFRRLVEYPELGAIRDDLSPGVRIWSINAYAVLYIPNSQGVDIAHVIHSARDIESLIARRS